MESIDKTSHREPWNKGKIVGQKSTVQDQAARICTTLSGGNGSQGQMAVRQISWKSVDDPVAGLATNASPRSTSIALLPLDSTRRKPVRRRPGAPPGRDPRVAVSQWENTLAWMSDARRDNRRELKLVLMRDLAEVAIRCKNGGRTLRSEETNDITDTVSKLYLRARDDEPELKRVLMTAKGCKGAVPDAAMKQLETLYDFLGSVASGGCGEAFVQDCARYARHIVDSNPDNAVLQRAWINGNYATRLAQAKVEGENELAEYLKRPAQRQPQDLSEALGFLAYHSASMDEEDWKDLIVDAIKESFKEMAKKDSYRASMLGTWAENLDKFTFKRALKQCVKDYPNLRREAEGRLKQLA